MIGPHDTSNFPLRKRYLILMAQAVALLVQWKRKAVARCSTGCCVVNDLLGMLCYDIAMILFAALMGFMVYNYTAI
jgi:hypothetical protein